MGIDIHHYLHNACPGASCEGLQLLRAQLAELKELFMDTREELAPALEAATERLKKIEGETRLLISRVEDLTAAVASARNLTDREKAALAALEAQTGVVDLLVPDVTAPPAEPEPPAQP